MYKTNPESSVQSSRMIEATPFFYGWVVLVVGTLSIMMMGPSQTFTISVFLDVWIEELAISRSTLSLLYGIGTLAASLLLPLTGRFVDRHGPRRTALVVAVMLGLACIGTSFVSGVVTVGLAILSLRFCGFGSLQLVGNNLIAQWFIRKRGVVMGIAGLSLGLSLLVFPGLAEWLIGTAGWRGAWVWLGILVWVVLLPLVILFYRDKPELYGLLPDGDHKPGADAAPDRLSELVAEVNWTAAEARHTAAFWVFMAALATLTMMTSSLVFHQLSLFEVRGLSREAAVTAFQASAPFSVVGNLFIGRIIDRVQIRSLVSGVLFLLAFSMLFVQVMTAPWHGFVYSAVLGFMGGAYRVIDSVVWPKYYGRLHLGAIRGLTMIGIIGGTAFGPYPLGFSLDYLGSYTPALLALLILPISLGIGILFVPRPEKSA